MVNRLNLGTLFIGDILDSLKSNLKPTAYVTGANGLFLSGFTYNFLKKNIDTAPDTFTKRVTEEGFSIIGDKPFTTQKLVPNKGNCLKVAACVGSVLALYSFCVFTLMMAIKELIAKVAKRKDC